MSPQPTGNPQPDLKLNSRVLALETGMYIFRYASRLPEGKEVCITLQQAPLGKGSVDFFPAEGVSRNTLVKLGDCVVIRIKGGTGAVLVTEYHLAEHGVISVDLRIDRIDTSEGIMKKAPAQSPPTLIDATAAPAAGIAVPTVANIPATTQTAPISLAFEGHIERRGDVLVKDAWLGNPEGRARIEGFSVSWPAKPQDVDLAYSCRVVGQGKQAAVLSGNFIGTRRKAAAIQAVTFGLIGPQQKSFQLSGQVVFAGCPPQDIVNGQEMSGPTGREHLVALRVNISPRVKDAPLATALRAKNEPNRYQSPWEDPAITQVYKAHG